MAKNKRKPEPFGRHVIAYCDGSCPQPNAPGGWGYVLIVGERWYQNHGGEEVATNQTMELTAALKAMKGIYEMGFARDQPIIICSDSMYLCNGMSEWRRKWERNDFAKVKNVTLWKMLFKAADEFDHLTFAWVRGHNGQFFNEMADRLADKGRLSIAF